MQRQRKMTFQQKLKQFMTGQHDYFRFNGNAMVIKKGEIIYQQSLGYADYDSKRPLNDSSVFRAGVRFQTIYSNGNYDL